MEGSAAHSPSHYICRCQGCSCYDGGYGYPRGIYRGASGRLLTHGIERTHSVMIITGAIMVSVIAVLVDYLIDTCRESWYPRYKVRRRQSASGKVRYNGI